MKIFCAMKISYFAFKWKDVTGWNRYTLESMGINGNPDGKNYDLPLFLLASQLERKKICSLRVGSINTSTSILNFNYTSCVSTAWFIVTK